MSPEYHKKVTENDVPQGVPVRYCKDCKFCESRGQVSYLKWMCVRPRTYSELNLVNGDTIWHEYPPRKCIEERTSTFGICGKGAIHFAPKN